MPIFQYVFLTILHAAPLVLLLWLLYRAKRRVAIRAAERAWERDILEGDRYIPAKDLHEMLAWVMDNPPSANDIVLWTKKERQEAIIWAISPHRDTWRPEVLA